MKRLKLRHAVGLAVAVIAGLLIWRMAAPQPGYEPQGLIGGIQGGISGGVNPTASVSIALIGDSNAVGQVVGQSAGVDGEADPAFALMTPITAIPYNKHYAQSSADPVPYLTDITAGGVQPYNVAGVENVGFQPPLAQEFVRAGYSAALYEHAISGIKALQFAPAASFPTLPPGTANLWNATVTRLAGRSVRAMIWVIGGNDGFAAPDVAALPANLTAMRTAARTAWGNNLVIVLVRNSANQAPAVTLLTDDQTAQDNFAAANPTDVVEVWTDDLALHSDNLHFNGNSVVILGQRVAYALLDRIGFPRFRPTAIPAIVGWAPLYTHAAGAYTVVSPGAAIDKDLEVMEVFSQTASGANNAIGTPTTTGAQVWTSRGTGTSTDGTSTTRCAIFTRPVTSADLTTGHGAMPPSTVPDNTNPINGARIFLVRSPTAGSTPSVDAIQMSVNNAFQTGLTLAQTTTATANDLILGAVGGYRTNATANPVTMAFTTPTNATNVFGSNRTVVVDFITHAVWSAQQAAAGATGATTVTFSLATLACGGIVGIKS